jgi:hypothetical protein
MFSYRKRERLFKIAHALPCASGPPHDPDLTAASASTVESIASSGFKARNTTAGRHLQPLENLSAFRIDAPQIALVIFQGGVPEFIVDPGDARHETAGFNGSKNPPGLGIYLVDLPVSVLTDPKSSLRPCEPRVASAAGCGN